VFEFSEKTTRLMYEQIHQTGFRQANKIQFPNSKADFCANPNKCSRRDISTSRRIQAITNQPIANI